MGKKLLDILRIGVFYDGYYFYKVSNYYKYEHGRKARISISGLQDFIKDEVAGLTNIDPRQCQIIDAHYFKGRSSTRELGEKVQSERIFEDILMRENVVTHYLPLRYGENNVAQEKGIDVWLALEAYELSIYKHFDILVLVAGDGDYVPLVRKLHTLGTQVVLLCWDFSYHNEDGYIVETKTSRQLMEEVFCPVCMHQKIDQDTTGNINNLFVPDRTAEKTQSVSGLSLGSAPPEEHLPEYPSVILTINVNGFGFIRDEESNNVFFHYNSVTNRDFSDLQPGMKVKYTREEDAQRSKRENAPRYKAVKVTVTE
ncbi:MAG: NYN domain-containing protein [Spirochaetia bacterium]|jgi:cold shock CspA family protein/uncharacterized LabA/DUF88 family protein|nr:NYN domain-containing protein [Spirochaetia bacterium]